MLAIDPPALLVGGQAVNVWAQFYANRTTDFAPFASRDADVFGDLDTLERLAAANGVQAVVFPFHPPTNEVGYVTLRDGQGKPLLVEVLRGVMGPTDAELKEQTYQFELGNPGVKIRVPNPIVLLQAKLANVIGLKQDGRQDAKHVLILLALIPAYLTDIVAAVRGGVVSERGLVNVLERLLGLVMQPAAKKAIKGLGLDPKGVFAELAVGDLPKVDAFLRKRLSRLE